MEETDWLFDVLYELSEVADASGMKRLSRALEFSMDAYLIDERAVYEALYMFRSRRGQRESPKPVRRRPGRVTVLDHSSNQLGVGTCGWGIAAQLSDQVYGRTRPVG